MERETVNQGVTGMADEQRRSTTNQMQDPGAGVGGRQGEMPLGGRGGGYPDVCTAPGPRVSHSAAGARDPRVDELRQLGLGPQWLELAEQIGYDAFLVVWQTLDGLSDDDRRRVAVPRFSTWRRFQRNRLIRSLKGTGYSTRQVQQYVRRHLREEVSLRHIDRVVAEG